MIGFGRAAVLEPDPPKKLLEERVTDDEALTMPHVVKGQWLVRWILVKVVRSGLPIQFFYHNMRQLGAGLGSDSHATIPHIVLKNIVGTVGSGLTKTVGRIVQALGLGTTGPKKFE